MVKSKLPFGSVSATLVKAEIVKERRSSLAKDKSEKNPETKEAKIERVKSTQPS
jgi:hypothetical protein